MDGINLLKGKEYFLKNIAMNTNRKHRRKGNKRRNEENKSFGLRIR